MENERESLEHVVGIRTRTLRARAGWSQSELGAKLKPYGFDMTQTTVAKLENGGRPVRVNEVSALAEIFGVPLVDMLRLDEGDNVLLVRDDERAVFRRRKLHFEALIADLDEKLEDARALRERAEFQVEQLMQRRADAAAKWAQAEKALYGQIRDDSGPFAEPS